MEVVNEEIRPQKFKISDEELYDMVLADKQEAEKFFSTYISPRIIMRYELLNNSDVYYSEKFPKLHNQCRFTASDTKDVVEWLMPSFTEVFFGADKVVGIFGRTRDDDPEILEKVIKYQIQSQNKGYVVLDQWIRDALEAGLGVLRMDWEHVEEDVVEDVVMTAEEFLYIPEDIAAKTIKKAESLPDGTYLVTRKNTKVVKNQPVIKNVMPGEYIYLPDENMDGQMVFECHRYRAIFDDLLRMEQTGKYSNLEDFNFVTNSSDDASMNAIADAIRNYDGEPKTRNVNNGFDASFRESQDARKQVMVYDCFGKYDVNKDGLLESVHIVIANDRIVFKEINEIDRSPFFHLSFYQSSYQKWKVAVADFEQDIQDVKSALIKQIIINTAQNNDSGFAVDANQLEARKDLEEGKKTVRFNLGMNRSISDLMQPIPQYQLPKEAFTLLELAGTWSEQKTGITKYNQGLDSGSLNKTATGISRIMEASQQRMRKMARDGAENGIVPLYEHLIRLDKKYLDSDFVFRLTNDYYDFAPDDITGDYDVQVTSNIGLQDKQLTIQNLMLMFTQILPNLLQMGAASPQGMWETAQQIIQEMGFTNPDKYIGMEAGAAMTQGFAQQLVQTIPQLMMQLGQQLGLSPEQAGAIAQQLAQVIQQQAQGQMQQQQQFMPPQAPTRGQSMQAINAMPTSSEAAREQGVFR